MLMKTNKAPEGALFQNGGRITINQKPKTMYFLAPARPLFAKTIARRKKSWRVAKNRSDIMYCSPFWRLPAA